MSALRPKTNGDGRYQVACPFHLLHLLRLKDKEPILSTAPPYYLLVPDATKLRPEKGMALELSVWVLFACIVACSAHSVSHGQYGNVEVREGAHMFW